MSGTRPTQQEFMLTSNGHHTVPADPTTGSHIHEESGQKKNKIIIIFIFVNIHALVMSVKIYALFKSEVSEHIGQVFPYASQTRVSIFANKVLLTF